MRVDQLTPTSPLPSRTFLLIIHSVTLRNIKYQRRIDRLNVERRQWLGVRGKAVVKSTTPIAMRKGAAPFTLELL
jgi:hypothetical protein